MSEVLAVPLRDRTGQTIAFAVIDAEDACYAAHSWYLDSDPSRRQGKLYARRTVTFHGRRVGVYLHRVVLQLELGDPRRVDHINGVTLDCRRANLRIATDGQNGQNRHIRRASASSRYRGVTWNKQKRKWMARGHLDGRSKTLGYFDDEDEAGRVAAAWRAQHMPFSEEARA